MPGYMITGFEIEMIEPTPWELVLTWTHGKQTRWPAVTFDEAVAQQNKICLRPEIMKRIEVVHASKDFSIVLFDNTWPRTNYRDLVDFPELTAPAFINRLLFDIDQARA